MTSFRGVGGLDDGDGDGVFELGMYKEMWTTSLRPVLLLSRSCRCFKVRCSVCAVVDLVAGEEVGGFKWPWEWEGEWEWEEGR